MDVSSMPNVHILSGSVPSSSSGGIGVLDVGEVEEEDGVGVGARVVLAHLLLVVQALPAGDQQDLLVRGYPAGAADDSLEIGDGVEGYVDLQLHHRAGVHQEEVQHPGAGLGFRFSSDHSAITDKMLVISYFLHQIRAKAKTHFSTNPGQNSRFGPQQPFILD